jgi:hypothetical protein
LASDRDSKKERGETALMPKPSDILPCTLFIKIMWEALFAFSRGKMHKKKRQANLPAFEIYVCSEANRPENKSAFNRLILSR